MGRPSKYNERYLIQLVCEAVIDDPCIRLSPTILEKRTGIPRYIWFSSAYPDLQKTIDILTRSELGSENQPFIIVNLAESIEKYIDSPKTLIMLGNKYDLIMNNLYDMAVHFRQEYAKLLKEVKQSPVTDISESEDSLADIIAQYNQQFEELDY